MDDKLIVLVIFFGLLIIFGIFEGIKSFVIAIIQAWKGPNYNTEFVSHLAGIYDKLDNIEKHLNNEKNNRKRSNRILKGPS